MREMKKGVWRERVLPYSYVEIYYLDEVEAVKYLRGYPLCPGLGRQYAGSAWDAREAIEEGEIEPPAWARLLVLSVWETRPGFYAKTEERAYRRVQDIGEEDERYYSDLFILPCWEYVSPGERL